MPAGWPRRSTRLRLPVGGRASFRRLRDDPRRGAVSDLHRREHLTDSIGHRGDRAALARSGAGRGAAKLEYQGFRVPMEEARGRFIEAAEIVVKALKNERFSHQGKYYQIPEMSIRPRPYSDFSGRLYGATISPESVEVMPKPGVGTLAILW